MEVWKIRLKHERDVRDCHVAVGNCSAPKNPDPEGGLALAGRISRFNGPKFWEQMKIREHDHAEFTMCKCSLTSEN